MPHALHLCWTITGMTDIPNWIQNLQVVFLHVKKWKDKAWGGFQKWKEESWVVSTIKAISIIAVVVNAVFGIFEKKDEIVEWFGLDRCHMFNPVTAKQDSRLPERPCWPKHVTFVEWTYPFKDNPDDIVNRPNRIFQLVSINGGEIEWGEQRLEMVNKREKWQHSPTRYYDALQGGELIPSWEVLHRNEAVDGDSGFILRRMDIVGQNCSSSLTESSPLVQEVPIGFDFRVMFAGVPEEEFFVQNAQKHNGGNLLRSYIYMRTITAFCGQDLGTSFRIGQDFSRNGFQVSIALMDQ